MRGGVVTASNHAGPSQGANGRSNGQRRSDQFLKSLAKFRGVTIVSHVHPDPDSLGAMVGLALLIEQKLGLPTILVQDGFIGRAENHTMVQCLSIPLTPIEAVTWDPDHAVVMVDSQPNTGRHHLPSGVKIHAVIDHHERTGDCDGVAFVDVRTGLGATCTLVTGYLMEQKVDLTPCVATALFYGIETELTGFPREAGPLDDGALLLLFQYAEKDRLAQIRNARLPLSYFSTLVQALLNTFVYDRLVLSFAGEMAQPEMAAEIADFLIRLNEVDWACCCGLYQDHLVLSMRCTSASGKAGMLLHEAIDGLGRAGGHDRRAGGSIPLPSTAPSAIEAMRAQVRKRLLQVLKIDEQRGQRIVPRRELLELLQG
jgi:nanoRNase/pAp phosphatase (c-di-AMP/oligoRNAs hydrolase)